MPKKPLQATVVCNRDGLVVYENGDFTPCKHIDIQEAKDFYTYLDKKINKKHKKPVCYGRSTDRKTEKISTRTH